MPVFTLAGISRWDPCSACLCSRVRLICSIYLNALLEGTLLCHRPRSVLYPPRIARSHTLVRNHPPLILTSCCQTPTVVSRIPLSRRCECSAAGDETESTVIGVASVPNGKSLQETPLATAAAGRATSGAVAAASAGGWRPGASLPRFRSALIVQRRLHWRRRLVIHRARSCPRQSGGRTEHPRRARPRIAGLLILPTPDPGTLRTSEAWAVGVCMCVFVCVKSFFLPIDLRPCSINADCLLKRNTSSVFTNYDINRQYTWVACRISFVSRKGFPTSL